MGIFHLHYFNMFIVPLIFYMWWGGWIRLMTMIIFHLIVIIIPASKNNYVADYVYSTLTKCIEAWHRYVVIIDKSDNENKVLSCVHPHGICADGIIITTAHFHNNNKKRIPLAHSIVFYIPLLNIILKLIGFDSISNDNMMSLMSKGMSLTIVPGGNLDMAYYRHKKHDVCINDRKGFIKYALKFGYSLQPVYHFSETSLYEKKYEQSDWEIEFGKSKNPFFIMLAFLVNLFTWGKTVFLAKRTPIFIVIGETIKLPLIHQPTKDDIDHWHKIYCDELTKLFNDYIDKWKIVDPGTDNKLFIR